MSDNYLDEYEGLGTEDLSVGIPFLSICQKAKEEQPEKKLGQWWHSSLNEALGKEVKIIPLSWRNVWVEKNASGRTVAYHQENSIPVLRSGEGSNFRIISKDYHNKVDCTVMILCVIPDKPDSFCFLMPSVSSLRTVKEWRKALTLNRLSSGRKAPIFSNTWGLVIGKESRDGNEYYIIKDVKRYETVPQGIFETIIQPVLGLASDPFALLPKLSEDTEEEEETVAEVEDTPF